MVLILRLRHQAEDSHIERFLELSELKNWISSMWRDRSLNEGWGSLYSIYHLRRK